MRMQREAASNSVDHDMHVKKQNTVQNMGKVKVKYKQKKKKKAFQPQKDMKSHSEDLTEGL